MKNKQVQTNRQYSSLGFTLIEVLIFIIMIACVLAGADITSGRFGGKFGWLLGAFFGVLVFVLGGLVLAVIKEFGVAGHPRLPRCRDGGCCGPGMLLGDYGDYKSQKVGEEHIYICQHGVRYKRRGKQFVIVNADGIETPYLIWRPFRGWFPDEPAKPKT